MRQLCDQENSTILSTVYKYGGTDEQIMWHVWSFICSRVIASRILYHVLFKKNMYAVSLELYR